MAPRHHSDHAADPRGARRVRGTALITGDTQGSHVRTPRQHFEFHQPIDRILSSGHDHLFIFENEIAGRGAAWCDLAPARRAVTIFSFSKTKSSAVARPGAGAAGCDHLFIFENEIVGRGAAWCDLAAARRRRRRHDSETSGSRARYSGASCRRGDGVPPLRNFAANSVVPGTSERHVWAAGGA
jgi:hypothetical protein